MKELCVLTPAIIDQQCIEEHIEHLKKNLFDSNPETQFTHIVQLCDHKRDGDLGDLNTIKNLYEQENSLPNCKTLVFVNSPRLGHVMAGYKLFQDFLNTKVKWSVVIEDDTMITNPIDLTLVEKNLSDDSILRFSYGCDYPTCNKWEEDWNQRIHEDFSTETPFIENEKVFSDSGIHIFKNKRTFCSWNGNFISKKMAKKITQHFNPKSITNCEDQIGNMLFYKSMPVYTIAVASGKCEVDSIGDHQSHKGWPLKKEHHVLLERYRSSRHDQRLGYLN